MTPFEEKRIADVRLTEADRGEILRYIGYSGQTIGPELEAQFLDCIERVNQVATPRLVYRIYKCKPEGGIPEELSFLTGHDIEAHLKDCQEILLMGATIGSGLDRAVHVEEMRDAVNSLIMDAAGSTLIEAVCHSFEAILRKEMTAQGRFITTRFSPGYGDLPLAIQNPFGDAIEIRRIGLTMTPEHIMVPWKSVTAVIGIADHPLREKKRTCADCNLHDSCRFRRNGVVCGE